MQRDIDEGVLLLALDLEAENGSSVALGCHAEVDARGEVDTSGDGHGVAHTDIESIQRSPLGRGVAGFDNLRGGKVTGADGRLRESS